MRKFFFSLTLLLGLAVPALAQVVDHWPTAQEALAATSAPFYYPTILSQRKLAEGEVVWAIPSGGVFDMKLPDRAGGRGWVRIEAGRRFVFERSTGQVLRLAECNNQVFGWEKFPPIKGLQGPVGPQGPQGPQGLPGQNGKSAEDLRKEAIAANTSGQKWSKTKKCLVWGGVAISGAILLPPLFKKKSSPSGPKGNGGTL